MTKTIKPGRTREDFFAKKYLLDLEKLNLLYNVRFTSKSLRSSFTKQKYPSWDILFGVTLLPNQVKPLTGYDLDRGFIGVGFRATENNDAVELCMLVSDMSSIAFSNPEHTAICQLNSSTEVILATNPIQTTICLFVNGDRKKPLGIAPLMKTYNDKSLGCFIPTLFTQRDWKSRQIEFSR